MNATTAWNEVDQNTASVSQMNDSRFRMRAVEANSIEDYLNRYYKRDRMTDTLVATYTREFEQDGYICTSHYDNITGEMIFWPAIPDGWPYNKNNRKEEKLAPDPLDSLTKEQLIQLICDSVEDDEAGEYGYSRRWVEANKTRERVRENTALVPAIVILNSGSAIRPAHRLFIDGVSVARGSRVELTPLFEELSVTPAKAIALRDAALAIWESRYGG